MDIEHPRWGAIMGVVSTKYIKAGEELFTYYGYREHRRMPSDYPWYWELKRKVDEEEEKRNQKQKHPDMNVQHSISNINSIEMAIF